MGKLLDGIKAIAQKHGHNFAGIEDVEAWCREQRGKPAPAPLLEDVAADLEEVTNVLRKVQEVLRNEDLLFAAEGLRSVFHVLSRHADLTRRLAEAEAEKARLSSIVEMVKHGLNGPWEPGGDVALAAKEAGNALQSIGLLRSVGDWSMYRELPVKVAAIQVRAEAAEARLAEVESSVGVVQYRRLEAQLHEAEARVLEMERFARHSDDCELVQPRGVHIPYCTCGLKAALAATEVPNA